MLSGLPRRAPERIPWSGPSPSPVAGLVADDLPDADVVLAAGRAQRRVAFAGASGGATAEPCPSSSSSTSIGFGRVALDDQASCRALAGPGVVGRPLGQARGDHSERNLGLPGGRPGRLPEPILWRGRTRSRSSHYDLADGHTRHFRHPLVVGVPRAGRAELVAVRQQPGARARGAPGVAPAPVLTLTAPPGSIRAVPRADPVRQRGRSHRSPPPGSFSRPRCRSR